MLYFRSILTVFEKRAFSSVTLNRSVWITHIVTPGGSPHRSPPRSVFRPLVAAPRIDAWLRCAGPDQVTMWVIHTQALSEAKGLSRSAARCFAALSMTGLDLSVDEELSSSFEPCLRIAHVYKISVLWQSTEAQGAGKGTQHR